MPVQNATSRLSIAVMFNTSTYEIKSRIVIAKRIPVWYIFIAATLYIFQHLAATVQSQSYTEPTFITRPRQLILAGKRSGEGYFSADGQLMIYQAEREADNPFYQIYLLDLTSGETQRVSTGSGKTTCAFIHPNQKRALFASTHADPESAAKQAAELAFRQSGQKRRYAWDYDPMMDLYTIDLNANKLQSLAPAMGYDAEGAYSPDGSQIVFTSNRAVYPQLSTMSKDDKKRLEADPAYFCDVYLMNADGTNVRRLLEWPGYDGGTFFSPDGQRIIFRHFNEEGTIADVYTMKIDGTDRQQVTDFESMSWAPYYHPSGQYVIFASNKLGFSNFELFIVDTQGLKEPVQVTYTDGFDGLPVFSPDGQQLSWTSVRTSNGAAQIFLANWNHEAALQALAQAPARNNSSTTAPTNPNPNPKNQELPPTHTTPGYVDNPNITPAELRNLVEQLASDDLQGRMTGTEGERKAANILAHRLNQNSLKAFQQGYTHPFSFNQNIPYRQIDWTKASIRLQFADPEKKHSLKANKNAYVLPFSASDSVKASLVFAGFSITTPNGVSDQDSYDSYANLDVKGKIAIIVDGVPEAWTAAQRSQWQQFTDPRTKMTAAREAGATAVIWVSSDAKNDWLDMTRFEGISSNGLVAVSISQKLLIQWLKQANIQWPDVQAALASGAVNAQTAFEMSHVSADIAIQLPKRSIEGRNVVAFIPPADSGAGPAEYVVIGAHYDHLGQGDLPAASLASGPALQHIHNGADDNASGTAVVAELAQYFAQLRRTEPQRFKRGLIIGFWSGEELGLIGSTQFLARPPINTRQMAAYLNFDMVGSLKNNQLIVQGTGSSSRWPALLEKKNVVAGFQLALQSDPYMPTDGTSFYIQQVPVLSFFTGLTPYYHKPEDDAHLLNYEGMTQIAQFASQLIT
jgi:Tol biopolymer transport system component